MPSMKKIIILISLILFLLAGANVYSQEPTPTPRKDGQNWQNCSTKTNENGNTDQYCTQKEPLLIKIFGSEGTNPNADKQRQDIDQKSSTKHIIDLVSIAITAIATVVVAFFTGLLWYYNKKLWKTAAQSAEAAKKAADALPIIERAYIFIETCGPNSFVGNNFTIGAKISNFGKTPAILIKIDAAYIWEEQYPIKFPEFNCRVSDDVSLIAPEKPQVVYIKTPYIPIGKLGKAFCCGLIEYEDIWKVRHETGFCWEVNPTTESVAPCKSPLNYRT